MRVRRQWQEISLLDHPSIQLRAKFQLNVTDFWLSSQVMQLIWIRLQIVQLKYRTWVLEIKSPVKC